MELPLLKDIFVIFGLAVGVALVCHRFKIPPVVGLIITGVIAGPHGLRLTTEAEAVAQLAEIGVIFLLFTIGLEFSIDSIRLVKRLFFVGGPLQVFITAGIVFLLAWASGAEIPLAVLIGLTASLSSTAIILKLLQDRAELTSAHGKGTMAILIFQDIVFVPMMLLIPFLAGQGSDNMWAEIGGLVVKVLAIWLVVAFAAPRLVPRLMTHIARTQSNELFLLTTGVMCFAVAWLTSLMGLSLALGAFLAGLILSDSEHSHRTLENILPFRDVFSSFFFVSMGMLLDARYVADHAPALLLATGAVILIKAVVSTGVMQWLGLPYRVSLQAGIGLAQTGEFSLILLSTGLAAGLLNDGQYQFVLAACLFSMVAAPFLVAGAHSITDLAVRSPMPVRFREGRYFVAADADERLRDHIVIVGYGVIGAMVGHSARLCNIPYEAIELNYDMVREQSVRGVPIFYGDATQEASLLKANVREARVVVVAIPDPNGTRRVVALARRLNPAVEIVTRTRYVRDMARLYALGANDIVSEEVEASIKIFSVVLEKYGVAPDVIEGFGGVTHRQHDLRTVKRDPDAPPY
ncbi:MAG: cation:proton antiporter [Candidatus Krumholzibacteria bacterium]|nr:cation:proton antiporter [Candidatus Krumholzibacteria bacterium]MDH4335859.1 cation:proton antiporter [Candidatus Krumholzibacteria bacterium]MDH5270351.1 cation:proton antiporter [Candidatus Krumholzibacteria bacterium]